MHASPIAVPYTISRLPQTGSPLSSSPASQQSSKARQSPARSSPNTAQQRSYSSQHLNTARIAKVIRDPNYTRSNSTANRSSPSEGVRKRTPHKGSSEKGQGSGSRSTPPARSTRPGTAGKGRGNQRQSRLSVETPAQATRGTQTFSGLEEKPLKGSNTPFDVRQAIH